MAIRPVWEGGWGHWVLARRSIGEASGIACHVCSGPEHPTLRDLITVAGARWAVEGCLQTAKGGCGLDHSRVRRYEAWYRHVTLAMAALAYRGPRGGGGKRGAPDGEYGLIPLSSPEIRRLIGHLIRPRHLPSGHHLR